MKLLWILVIALALCVGCGGTDEEVDAGSGSPNAHMVVEPRWMCDPPVDDVTWVCADGECCYPEDEDWECCVNDLTGAKKCWRLDGLSSLSCG